MRFRLVILSILFATLSSAAVVATAQVQQANSSDENAIRSLMEVQFSSAFNADTADKGVEIMRGVLSDKSYATIVPQSARPSEAFVGDKKWFCEHLAEWLRNGRQMKMVHRVRQISITGPIAYEIGESRYSGPGHKASTEVWLNILAKEELGWRLVFATPADDAQRAMRQLDAPTRESAK